MPLGHRIGDGSDAQFCGLELQFELELPEILATKVISGCFDFVVARLDLEVLKFLMRDDDVRVNLEFESLCMHPAFRPSQEQQRPFPEHLQYAGSDLKFKSYDWKDHVVAKISSWIDLDSEDETVRMDSEAVLRQEIARACYLTVQTCLLPAPKGTSCVNYARCVKQILQDQKNMKLWLRIPLGKPDDGSSASSTTLIDSWETWNSFRLLCGHHSQLFVALDNLGALPSEDSLKRWYGESVSAAIIHTDSFLSKGRGDSKYLSKRQQKLITDFFEHSIQIIITGKEATASDPLHTIPIAGSRRDPLLPYHEYISSLYQRLDPLPLQECFEFGIRDFLQSPSQPLKDLSEALNHENLEKDLMKYTQYKKAIHEALVDRVPDEKASAVTTVVMIVGARRGPLVRASIQAAEESRRMIKVYAVDKNKNTAVPLRELIFLNNWKDAVTIVTSDVRYWNAPETADIMVSELLGSFGDDELSPEFLDGAQRFLKEDGISIPTSYTNFLQPLTASKLYNDVKSRQDILNSETACVVKMHKVARLAPCQPVFTFTHPKHVDKESNQRYKKLQFVIPNDTGSATVHGFAGYFDATLYKDVHLGIEPSTATPNLHTWFPMFFPLRTPIRMHRGSTLEVHFWRCSDSTKIWYEWCVTSPSTTPIHNCNGRSFWVSL